MRLPEGVIWAPGLGEGAVGYPRALVGSWALENLRLMGVGRTSVGWLWALTQTVWVT